MTLTIEPTTQLSAPTAQEVADLDAWHGDLCERRPGPSPLPGQSRSKDGGGSRNTQRHDGREAQMNRDKYLRYGLAGGAAIGLAAWTGVPAYFLLLLACPPPA